MEAVLVCCHGCGSRIRVRRPGASRERRCPRCATILGVVDSVSPSRQRPRDPAFGIPRPFTVAALALTLAATALGYAGVRTTRNAALVASTSVRPSRPDRDPIGVRSAIGLFPGPGVETPFRPAPEPVASPGASSSSPEAESPAPANVTRPSVAPIAASTRHDPGHVLASPPPPLRTVPTNRYNALVPDPAATTEGPPQDRAGPKRIRVRLPDGRTVVARVHGAIGSETHIMLPDGQLGIPDRLVFTDQPFVPATPGEMIEELRDGPFRGFEVRRTAHYLILYRSSAEFAEESGRVLENLYRGLTEAFQKRGIPVHDAEFPLVAVIFGTEREFREHKPIAAEIQAYYEIYTNRIHFYQTSDRDDAAPEVAAVRRPQTVAHEGTHQILQNIGIQPRLAAWPLWLIEGLAEYCATPRTTKRGTTWGGLGMVNAQHLATIRDLNDPLSGQVPGAARAEHIGRPVGMTLVEYLITKDDLTPTDYALAWAMTHYLAMKRVDEFVAFIQAMGAMPPLQAQSPQEHLAAFRAAFGGNLGKLDKEIGAYLTKLKTKDHLPFYAVTFQQRLPGGMLKRAAIVSQSPSMIQQWLETVTSTQGDPPIWEAVPHPTRTRAFVTASQWMRGS